MRAGIIILEEGGFSFDMELFVNNIDKLQERRQVHVKQGLVGNVKKRSNTFAHEI